MVKCIVVTGMQGYLIQSTKGIGAKCVLNADIICKMDRKTFLKAVSVLFANAGMVSAFATNLNIEKDAAIKISEGPYLLSMDGGKVCVVFMTNKRAVASVAVSSQDDKNFSKSKVFFDSSPTGRKHIGTLHTIWLGNLAAGKSYSYKIEIKEVLEYWETYKGAKYGARKVKQGYRSHKLKPYRKAAKAEKAAFKANVNFQYHKTLHDNPQLTSNPLSRFWQKQQIKKQYAKAAKAGSAKGIKTAAENTRKAAAKAAEKTRQTIAFVARHPAGVCIAIAALLLIIFVFAGLSSCSAMFSGTINGVVGTSYTSEDSDLVAVENSYAAMENELQSEIDNIERTHPGYDEYRYDLDTIGHNPHELASYLTALLQSYTPESAQAEIERIFGLQYTLTLTEEVEIRYREEERTNTWTDEDSNEHEETYTVQVPYEYHILNVELTNKPISSLAEELLTPEQLEMFRVYMETSGNKPLIFGGGSPDTSASEDLSGVQFVNGTRPGNTALVDLAKQQVGNVGGYPYWSWYGFNSRVEWCACFVSWCYNRAGASEPKFAACQSQGVPWFQSRGQWGARGYENIAPGDAIFFDWDLDGSADHVGIVIGTDGSRVYTVEGNSGDACKIKSYDLNYQCIKGYGLMNW